MNFREDMFFGKVLPIVNAVSACPKAEAIL
jgi:hypothetical protein